MLRSTFSSWSRISVRLGRCAAGGLAMAAACLSPMPASAQAAPDTLIVFDASGSMWGQIQGRTKIEIARETLSTVLSEVSPDMNIGMIAYGHRVRGQCSDIETLVPMGPAGQTVPRMIDAANRINPRGMTPLSDAVRKAAEEMLYTERAATVVLVTDGIETCDADPCALGAELEAAGIDFTAHVVGFGLTGDEGRQVACLAETTGGRYIPADDADQLVDALRRTIGPDDGDFVDEEDDFVDEPVTLTRNVEIILRDTEGGERLTRQQVTVLVEPLAEDGTGPEGFEVHSGNRPFTASGGFVPGRYHILVQRQTDGRQPIRVRLPFDVPEGEGTHVVDLVIAARLKLNAFANADLPMPAGNGNLPFAHYGSDSGRAHFDIHPIIDGAIDISTNYGGINSRIVAVPPGDYFIRGGLARSFSRERLVNVPAGTTTEYDFDFEAGRVQVDVRDGQGFPVQRQNAYFYDAPDGDHFTWGGAGPQSNGELLPFYLPQGSWRVDAGRSGGGQDRAQAVFSVRPREDVRLDLRERDRVDEAGLARLMAEDNAGCLPISGYQCSVEQIGARDVLAHIGIEPDSAQGREMMKPRFTGTWQTTNGMMALVQEGRKVWGDVPSGRLWGEVAADGLTVRGVMDVPANPWGVFEFRLSADGLGFEGGWGRGVKPALGNATYAARRLSAGAPPLVRATKSDADLPEALRGGADAAFEAFMAPARMAASDDLDEMQANAAPVGFAGMWSSNHQALTLHQSGRRVWGERDRGVLEGEVSADGRTLRGTWTNTNGDWGLFEFVQDDARGAFTGAWGRRLDTELKGGAWTGTRASYLAGALVRATGTDSDRSGDVRGGVSPEFEAFMAPVRDPAPNEPEDVAIDGQPNPHAEEADGEDHGFVPARRYDFASMTTMQPAAAFVFAARAGNVEPGKVLLREGWCGEGCAAETLDIVHPSNAEENLYKGGYLHAISSKGPLSFVSEEVARDVIKVEVRAATGDFRNGDQATGETFATMIGRRVAEATLDGFDLAAAPVQPSPPAAAAGEALIPPGIYGLVEGAGFDPSNSADIGRAVTQCAQAPFIAYPDGHLQAKAHSPAAAVTGVPFRTVMVGTCTAVDGGARCGMRQPGMPDEVQTMELGLTPIADGHIRIVNRTRGNAEGLLYACVRPGGEMSATETLPDGRKAIDHIMQRDDGGPELSYADDGTYLGPKVPAPVVRPPAPTPGGDFSAIAGFYGRLSADGAPKQGEDLLNACYSNGLVVYRDGFARGFRENPSFAGPDGATPPPIQSMHMMCAGGPDGARCEARQGAYPDGMPVPEDVRLSAKPQDMIEICIAGSCFLMQQCRDPRTAFAGDDPAPDGRHWLDHVLTRPDMGPGLE